MTGKEIFKNYMDLSYSPGLRLTGKVKDIVLGGLVILRTEWIGSTVHYLQDGSSLFIPWTWMDLFTGLWVHSGDQILYNSRQEAWDSGYEEAFIRLFTELIDFTQGAKQVDGEEFLDILSDICILKTEEFRKMLREKYSIVAEPFEYRSLHKTFEV